MLPTPWYEDVPKLIIETDKLYGRIIEKGGRSKSLLTKEKTIEVRGWQPSLSYIKDNFEEIIQRLGFFYIPKNMAPGPMFVFPIRDLEGKYTRAQTKPLEGSVRYSVDNKYYTLGGKAAGPPWLGNDPITIEQIIKKQACLAVEGGFDLLAVRLLAPELPSLCPVTKKLGKGHIDYLRILGVKYLYLLLDNEEARKGQELGQGNDSMRYLQNTITSMKVKALLCPANDPSEALKSSVKVRLLQSLLQGIRYV